MVSNIVEVVVVALLLTFGVSFFTREALLRKRLLSFGSSHPQPTSSAQQSVLFKAAQFLYSTCSLDFTSTLHLTVEDVADVADSTPHSTVLL